jgi:acetyl esterase
MPLDPQAQAFLDQMAAMGGKQLHEMTPQEGRLMSAGLAAFGVPVQEVARVDNRMIPGPGGPLRVRVYSPDPREKVPALVYFHGGGWVVGGLESHDRECRALANLARVAVIAVDYRLAPENPFPAAVDDCFAATKFVADHADEFGIDRDRIAVGGDSAGGNLAAVAALMARNAGGPPIVFQLLVYPVTDMTASGGTMEEFAEGPFLTAKGMDWFNASYVPNPADRHDWRASPMFAADFRGLPPAMVMTAECDPLRDQGEAYAGRLREAGVVVTVKRYEGMFHPFFSLGGVIDGARTAMGDAAAALRAVMSTAAAA